ncbi:hypothetical protein FA014_04575, partial [Cellulomonas hominis]
RRQRALAEQRAHAREVAAEPLGVGQQVHAVVLAQASMAGAAARADVAVPVLTSPAGGVAELVGALGIGGTR